MGFLGKLFGSHKKTDVERAVTPEPPPPTAPPSPPDPDGLAEGLHALVVSRSAAQREAALVVIRAIDRERAIAGLLGRWRTADKEMKREILDALVEIGDARALPIFKEALTASYWVTQERAADGIVKVAGPEVVSEFQTLAADPIPNRRIQATMVLAKVGGAAARDTLVALALNDSFHEVRIEARRRLEKLDPSARGLTPIAGMDALDRRYRPPPRDDDGLTEVRLGESDHHRAGGLPLPGLRRLVETARADGGWRPRHRHPSENWRDRQRYRPAHPRGDRRPRRPSHPEPLANVSPRYTV